MNLLIVEDEDIIRQGLIVSIQKLAFSFDTIYESANGKEALDLCRQHRPDLILTDIKMPLMDGLTFIKYCRDILPASPIIILSGYNDFHYAQQAIKYQVADYLLKPAGMSELKKVFSNVIGKIEQEKQQETLRQTLVLKDIIREQIREEDCIEYLSRNALSFSLPFFCVLSWLPEADCEDPYTIQGRLAKKGTCFALHSEDRYCYSLLNLRKSEAATDSLSSLWHMLRENLPPKSLPRAIGFSKISDRISSLPLLYRQAREALHVRLFHSEENAFFYDTHIPPASGMPSLPETSLETLYHDLAWNSELNLEKHFERFLFQLSELDGSSPQVLIQSIHTLEHYLATRLVKEGFLSRQAPLSLNFENCMCAADTLKDLAASAFQALLRYKRALSPEKISPIHSPVEQAILYIETNYREELDLQAVADMVSMNSSYFSTLFKKKTGMNFITFLQNVRIEKAKELLVHTNLKLYEISESVGIMNDKYFCRLFKAATGMTPTDYRKRGTGSTP